MKRPKETIVLLALGSLAIAGFLFVALEKGGGGDENGTVSSVPVPVPTSAEQAERAQPRPAERKDSPRKGPQIPTIVVRGGEPVGGVAELDFDAGEVVRFRVKSDVADELHLHGYDISKPVSAGGSASFEFTADIEGIFELELEERAVQLAELQINP